MPRTPTKKGAVGRPRVLDRDAIGRELCERISQGELANAVCKSLGITPDKPWRWGQDDPEFGKAYARARELQAHAWHERAIEAAHGVDDYASAVEAVLEMERNRIDEIEDERARNAAYAVLRSLEAGAVQRDRLRVDTLKWSASKLAPRVYGEKQAVEHSGSLTAYVAHVPTKQLAAEWAKAHGR